MAMEMSGRMMVIEDSGAPKGGEGQASDPILTSLRRRVWWMEGKDIQEYIMQRSSAGRSRKYEWLDDIVEPGGEL
jgi:hypothetical protein